MRLKHRNLLAVILLSIITFGIYQFYWLFITKTEMNVLNSRDNKVPTFIVFFIPLINLWWFYRFCRAMEAATKGALRAGVTFFAPIVLYVVLFVTFVFINAGTGGAISLTLDNPTIWYSLSASTILGLLPILYYQSNLNKVAR